MISYYFLRWGLLTSAQKAQEPLSGFSCEPNWWFNDKAPKCLSGWAPNGCELAGTSHWC